MRVLFIATFPAKHFQLYGETFIRKSEEVFEELNRLSDHSVRMEISIDDLDMMKTNTIQNLKYVKLIDYHLNLYKRNEFVEQVSVDDESDLDIAGDVAKQIVRWSFKGMMQIHYLKFENQNYDYIIYIDADTQFSKKLRMKDLIKLLPSKDELLSAVFRHDIQKYTETGWIAWNTNNQYYSEWVETYSIGWQSHVYEKLNAYHDCAIFDWACEEIKHASYKNLSGGGDHGFNSGLLGEFIDHKKGIRKHLGLSYEKIPGMNTQLGAIIYKIIFGAYIRLKKFKRSKDC